LHLATLMQQGCDRVEAYLKTNANAKEQQTVCER
jgi:hypothetical protein